MLELKAVSKRFERKPDVIERFARRLGADVPEHVVHAVDRVSFSVAKGEVVGSEIFRSELLISQKSIKSLPGQKRE